MTWKWAGPSVAYSPPGRPASQPAAGTRVSRGTGGGEGLPRAAALRQGLLWPDTEPGALHIAHLPW